MCSHHHVLFLPPNRQVSVEESRLRWVEYSRHDVKDCGLESESFISSFKLVSYMGTVRLQPDAIVLGKILTSELTAYHYVHLRQWYRASSRCPYSRAPSYGPPLRRALPLRKTACQEPAHLDFAVDVKSRDNIPYLPDTRSNPS